MRGSGAAACCCSCCCSSASQDGVFSAAEPSLLEGLSDSEVVSHLWSLNDIQGSRVSK